MNLFKRIRDIAGKNELYIVGGWLRDTLLKRENRDLDLAVPGNPLALARKTARALGGSLVVLDRANGVYRVVLKEQEGLSYLDFARLKGPDILADLRRRDFPVNAMALPVTGALPDLKRLIDPLNGRGDLRKKTIRAASPAIFDDDPLRMLRAFRLAAELGFTIDRAALRLIKRKSPLIAQAAGERVREELFRILARPDSSRWLREMDGAGLLDILLPEIVQMKRSARAFYYHPLGLWQHARQTLASLEQLLGRLEKSFPEYRARVAHHLDEPLSQGVTRRSLLKLVALLHDVAKPRCARRVGKRMRFLGHEEEGAKTAAAMLKRLRLSNVETKIARRLIEHHMRPISLGQAPALTPRAAFRFFRDLDGDAPDLILLSLSDVRSYRGLDTQKTVAPKKLDATLRELMRRYFAEREKPAQPRLLDGHDVMKAFKLKPGPAVGRLLKFVAEAQALGKVASREEALRLAGKSLTRIKK